MKPVVLSWSCLFIFLLPFIPDFKLAREKLLFFQLGVLGLVGLSGLQIILSETLAGLKEKCRTQSTEEKGFVTAFFIWVVVAGVMTVFAYEKSLAMMEWRRVLLAVGAFVGFRTLTNHQTDLRLFYFAWLAGCVISLAVGAAGYNGADRFAASFGNPIFLSAYLNITLFVGLLLALHPEIKKWMRCSAWIAIVIILIALYFTKTRAAWVAVVAAGFAAILLTQQKKISLIWILTAVGGAGVFVFLTREVWLRDQAHLLIWRDALRMWLMNPLVGVGPGAFHIHFPAWASPELLAKWPNSQFIVNYAHNEFIQTLVEGGILLFLPFIIGIVMALTYLLSTRRTLEQRLLGCGALSLALQNFFSVDMRFGISFGLFFGVLSLAMGGETREESRPSQRRPVLVALWILIIVALGAFTLKPYIAERRVHAQKDFFDVRLLDPVKTIADLETLRRSYPQEIPILEKLAYAYAKEIKTTEGRLNVEMKDKAVATYFAILELDPNHIGAMNNLGNIYFTSGEPQRAVGWWRKGTAVRPDFVDAHLNLGKAYYSLGQLKEAAREFEKVNELDPGNAEAVMYLKKMVE